ncbi:contractile injection system tape measure protein [Pantoea sp. A4]|uniref:contractile injection system tape measure protein n=1 Tax=Pantoea sp. A4 TaxID=1225184 RepID=UPI0003826E52|nr:contractile injection system tape measure protein [Pantoea sp. A4]
MPIDRVTVSLATSRTHAASLQQQVSQLMQQLNPQLAALLARYLPADAMLTAPLRLNIGTLPLSQFSSQFAPRLLAALEQVLQQWEIDPADRFAVPADQDRDTADGRVVSHNPEVQESHRELSGDTPGVSPVVEAAPPEWSTLLRYLSNGYWPTFATVAQPVASGAVQPDATAFKQQGEPVANAQAGSRRTPQRLSGQRHRSQPLPRQRVAGQRKSAPVAVNAPLDSRHTPQRLSGQRHRSQPLLRQRVADQRKSAPVAVNAQAGSRHTSQPLSGPRRTPQHLLRQRVADQRKSASVAVNAPLDSRNTPQRFSGQRDTPQPLLRQRVADQRKSAPVGVNAQAGSRRTPQQLLRQRLMGQPAISPNERAALIGALQLPGARQRLLRLMTASDWRQLCALLAPAARLSTPSPLALLLLLWQQPGLPVLQGFSAAELRPPQPQELRELERLLTADNPQPLLALQPWLAQQTQQPPAAVLTAEVARQPEGSLRPVNQRQGWQQRLSARAQQQLARLKPATRNASPPAPKPQPLPEQLELHHAGLVLLWPLLPGWLRSLGLVIQTEPQAPLRFSGPEAQQQAIALLDALIWQDDAGGEWRSLCSKLLCGWPLEWPLDQAWPQELARQQAQQLEPALQALLLQLPGLKNLSLPELRQLFLQRPGTLEQQRFGWQLSVQPHPADILLRHIPWPLEQIHYSWLSEPVTLHWPRPGDAFAL